jgi:hypothetical protein
MNLVYKRDRLSTNEWVLIYNDLLHIRYRFLMVLLVPTALLTLTLTVYEYRKYDGKFQTKQLAKLRRDIHEVRHSDSIISSILGRCFEVRDILSYDVQRLYAHSQFATPHLQDLSERPRSL